MLFGRHFEMESFFFKYYFTNVNLFMFSYFEPNFIEIVHLEKCFFFFFFFSDFGQNRNDANIKLVIWPPFCSGTTFIKTAELCLVQTYLVQISLQNSGGKVVSQGDSMKLPLRTNRSENTVVILIKLLSPGVYGAHDGVMLGGNLLYCHITFDE